MLLGSASTAMTGPSLALWRPRTTSPSLGSSPLSGISTRTLGCDPPDPLPGNFVLAVWTPFSRLSHHEPPRLHQCGRSLVLDASRGRIRETPCPVGRAGLRGAAQLLHGSVLDGRIRLLPDVGTLPSESLCGSASCPERARPSASVEDRLGSGAANGRAGVRNDTAFRPAQPHCRLD